MVMTHSSREDFHEVKDKDATFFEPMSEEDAETSVAHVAAPTTEPVELNLADPHFMASAYDTYADLRTKGPTSRVRFVTGDDEEEALGDGAKEQRPEDLVGGETFFV